MAFTCEQRVDWGDCDTAGVVFYPHYFRWMDSAFHRLCEAAGFGQRRLREDFGLVGTPLIDARCGFAAPASYGETLSVAATISRWGDSSLSLEYRFARAGIVVAEGGEARVCVRPTKAGGMQKAPLPQDFRAALQGVVGTPGP